MKTLKATLLIVLGSFFLASSFAFAGESAFMQLSNGPSFDGAGKNYGDIPVLITASAPAPSAAAAVTPKPKPSAKERIMKWTGEHKTKIFMGGVGAYIGFALVGTLFGACTFGLGTLLVLAVAAA